MNKFVDEFKQFILRGNVVDLAVGIIIGAAFNGIVTSLVNDVIMPPIGLVLGGVDFSSLYLNLSGTAYSSLAAADEAGAAVIRFGIFINALINFLVVSFAVFLLVKAVNHLQKKPPATPELPKPDPALETQQRLLVVLDRLARVLESKG